MTTTLSFDEALQLLDRAVAEKGEDYVYPHWQGSCQYFDFREKKYEQPSCVVGHVISYIGIKGMDVGENNDNGVNEMALTAGLEMDTRTLYLLRVSQQWQDTGHTWGVAREVALSAVKDLDNDGFDWDNADPHMSIATRHLPSDSSRE